MKLEKCQSIILAGVAKQTNTRRTSTKLMLRISYQRWRSVLSESKGRRTKLCSQVPLKITTILLISPLTFRPPNSFNVKVEWHVSHPAHTVTVILLFSSCNALTYICGNKMNKIPTNIISTKPLPNQEGKTKESYPGQYPRLYETSTLVFLTFEHDGSDSQFFLFYSEDNIMVCMIYTDLIRSVFFSRWAALDCFLKHTILLKRRLQLFRAC